MMKPTRRRENRVRSNSPKRMSFYRFSLTFGEMQGTSWLRAPSCRLLARALSATVVLAFLAFPVFAQADSAGAQYQDRLPTATNTPTHHDHTPGGGGHHGGSGGQDSGNGGSSQGGAAGGGGGSSPPSGPSSSPSGASSRSSGAGNGGASGGAPTQGSGTDTVKLASNAGDQTGNSNDGSSPLAGILVGLGLGAIVSVLFVALRARRQRGRLRGSSDAPRGLSPPT